MDHRLSEFHEGNPFSKLSWLMSYYGRNVELEFSYATVLAPLPKIKIKLDNGLVLDDEDLVVLEHLRERTEEMVIKGQTEIVTVKSPLKQADRVLVAVPDAYDGAYWIIGKV